MEKQRNCVSSLPFCWLHLVYIAFMLRRNVYWQWVFPDFPFRQKSMALSLLLPGKHNLPNSNQALHTCEVSAHQLFHSFEQDQLINFSLSTTVIAIKSRTVLWPVCTKILSLSLFFSLWRRMKHSWFAWAQLKHNLHELSSSSMKDWVWWMSKTNCLQSEWNKMEVDMPTRLLPYPNLCWVLAE